MQARFFIVVLTVIVAVIACNGSREETRSSNSQLNIVGGEAVQANEYPSVVKLTVESATSQTPPKFCTGVIISHRTVLAAAHCIKRRSPGANGGNFHFVAVEAGATRAQLAVKSALAITYKEPLGVSTIPENHVSLDLAVLDFGDHAFNLTSYPKIISRPPVPGENLTLVGFGATSLTEQTTTPGALNKGKNILRGYDPADGYFMVSGRINEQGFPDGALAAPGDSGGPVFNSHGELMGIGSALDIQSSVVTNYFVDLSSHESQTLIGRYLQEFGTSSTAPLIGNFSAAMGDGYQNIKPRTLDSSGTFLAMCWGNKGKKDKDRGGKGGLFGRRKGDGGKGDVSVDVDVGGDDDDDDILVSSQSSKDSVLGSMLGKNPGQPGPSNGTNASTRPNSDTFEAGGESPIIVVTQR